MNSHCLSRIYKIYLIIRERPRRESAVPLVQNVVGRTGLFLGQMVDIGVDSVSYEVS
jgi:hypothetical protein